MRLLHNWSSVDAHYYLKLSSVDTQVHCPDSGTVQERVFLLRTRVRQRSICAEEAVCYTAAPMNWSSERCFAKIQKPF